MAERYLDNTLSEEERTAFEKHFVDCAECMDRLALAGMFHARNEKVSSLAAAPLPLRARFVAQFKPWQLVLIFAVSSILLIAIPTAYFLWQLGVLFTLK